MKFLRKVCAVKPLDFGFNSYGAEWTPIQKLKHLEKEERGNKWFDDSKLDLNKTFGIWVTEKPVDALMYNYPSEYRNLIDEYGIDLPVNIPSDCELMEPELYDEFRTAIKNPEAEVTKVSLKGAIPVITHYEEFGNAYLYIKPVYKK